MLTESTTAPSPAIPAALAGVLACPACRSALPHGGPCTTCGWRSPGGVLDFVSDADVSAEERAELAAQAEAVGVYYENEDKLSCHWDRLSAAALPEMAGPGAAGMVLDLGCGTGSAGAAFRRAGNTVVGADLSPQCVQVASQRLDAVVRCHSSHLPFRDGSFDVVVARGALHHLQRADLAVAEAWRVLRPGGVFLALDPREFRWLEPIKAVIRQGDAAFTDDHHAYEVDEYRELIGAHFEVEDVSTMHPFAIMVAVGLDLVPLPKALPKRGFARVLLGMDERLNRTKLRKLGHLVAIRGRKRG